LFVAVGDDVAGVVVDDVYVVEVVFTVAFEVVAVVVVLISE
jgi:hypothetical protein